MLFAAIIIALFFVSTFQISTRAATTSTGGSNATSIRVAFLMSGSPRSFIYPFVHESIRINLIQAFCPSPQCIADVFARISCADNTHEISEQLGGVKNSTGITIPADESDMPLVKHALSRIQKTVSVSGGDVFTKWVEIGSIDEATEMNASFSSTRHRIFRTLDPRRYSMYFGRWSVFAQAKNRESIAGAPYDWFVLTRFDMAFGEPMQPHYKWPPSKLWVHDSWAANVPDIFGIVPAAFASPYFSIEDLLKPGIMCLGGPNFDRSTIETPALIAKQFTADDISIIYKAICKFEDDGWSEEFLKRKLQLSGISADKGNIGYASIYSVVIRKNFKSFCFITHPRNLILRLYGRQTATSAHFSSCPFLIKDFIYEQNTTTPICPAFLALGSNPHRGQCIVNKRISDWNFMPFSIHPFSNNALCFTSEDSSLVLRPCISIESLKEQPKITTFESANQLFYFYPLLAIPQLIRHHSYYHRNRFHQCINGEHIKDGANVSLDLVPQSNTENPHRLKVNLKNKKKRLSKVQEEDSASPILKRREKISLEINGFCIHSHSSSAKLVWKPCPRRHRGPEISGTDHIFIIERSYTKIISADQLL